MTGLIRGRFFLCRSSCSAMMGVVPWTETRWARSKANLIAKVVYRLGEKGIAVDRLPTGPMRGKHEENRRR